MSRSPMNRRRLALASIAVVTVLALVGVSILAVAAGGSALAYEVNGSRVSQDTVDSMLHDIADSVKGSQTVSQSEGSVSSQVSSQVLTTSILRDVLRDAAHRRGKELTAADRAAGTATAKTQLGANASQVPESYRNIVVETYAYANALGLTSTDALNTFVTRELKRTDVYVNPRYGTWNPRYGVCPPTGCQSLATGATG